MASAISWNFVRWNKIFTKRHMRLKLCCVKIWHYFDNLSSLYMEIKSRCMAFFLCWFHSSEIYNTWQTAVGKNIKSLFAFYSKSDFAHSRSRVPLREYTHLYFQPSRGRLVLVSSCCVRDAAHAGVLHAAGLPAQHRARDRVVAHLLDRRPSLAGQGRPRRHRRPLRHLEDERRQARHPARLLPQGEMKRVWSGKGYSSLKSGTSSEIFVHSFKVEQHFKNFSVLFIIKQQMALCTNFHTGCAADG